ncbi:MAG: ATP-dependent DNA ligase, partial [Terrabacter sp.]
MAKASEAYVRAGEREVRISSPERVIYEATERTPEVTKLMVAEYFTSVEEGLMRALRDRPTALERWTSGVRPGMTLRDASSLSSSGTERHRGRADRGADAFYQKRVPKGAPDYLEAVEITFPSGRTAEEICPTEIAVPVWCAQMGTLT